MYSLIKEVKFDNPGNNFAKRTLQGLTWHDHPNATSLD